MKFRTVLLVVTCAASSSAQHQHAPAKTVASQAPTATMQHHACLDEERAAIERGEGFGMALAADRNGYPGPRHVLELKKDLKLTAEQQAAIEKVFAEMSQRAVAQGRDLLAEEKRLEELFAQNRSESELREETYRVASLRAELRWVHLSAHLATRKLLTAGQLAAYQRLRHSAAGPAVAK